MDEIGNIDIFVLSTRSKFEDKWACMKMQG